MYRGELGIDSLNLALREALNPDGQPVRGGRLRIGDKLMMTGRNLHELGLMNGTLLRLLDEVSGSDDDESRADPRRGGDDLPTPAGGVRTLASRLRLLGPPWAGDRAPGCGDRRSPRRRRFFLRREMLYTAVTRAKIATVIVGTRTVIARAARTPDTGRRHSRGSASVWPPTVPAEKNS